MASGADGGSMTDPIEIDRDDGSRLALSRAEARRAHGAYARAVLADEAGAKVGACGGKSRCETCRRVQEGRRDG